MSDDILSAALRETGIPNQQQEQLPMKPSTSSLYVMPAPQSRITTSDIKPLLLNGQMYYQTPKGVVQFREGNKICLVSEMELRLAFEADKIKRQMAINNATNYVQLLQNGMTENQFIASPYNLLNNPQLNSQLINGSLLINEKVNNQFLISNNFKQNIHEMQDLAAQNAAMNTSLLNQLSQMPTQSTYKSVNNQFQTMYNELAQDKDLEKEEVEDDFVAETYSEYVPTKVTIGYKHPDAVVETASLASVLPPDPTYSLCDEFKPIYNEKLLSNLQCESIIYASQQHEQFLEEEQITRAGFLIGDGAGVGKGRTVAGIIYENYLRGRKKSIWLSVSNDLKYDAERDLRDIGASKIKVHALNKLKYGKIRQQDGSKLKKGVIFSTYSSLISQSQSVNGKCGTRLGQLIDWFGKDYDGVIIFDECHKAKNLCPVDSKGSMKNSSKTATKCVEIQQSLPNARIVYASATGATEPRNMAYMVRLGLWGTPSSGFDSFEDFQRAVDRRGVGAMELVAMEMKQRGVYIARQLSFKGVEFEIQEVNLNDDFIKLYNDCVDLWASAREKFVYAAFKMCDDGKDRKTIFGQFWSAHQRFFKYLCIAAKVTAIVEKTKQELRDGNAVVIGLQSTGESRTKEAFEECAGELDDFVSTTEAVFTSLVEKHFPAPNRKKSLQIVNDLNMARKNDKDYTDRSSRRARQETQKKIKKSVQYSSKAFINDGSETEDEDETEIENSDSEISNSDYDFKLSSSDEENIKKRNKRNNNAKRSGRQSVDNSESDQESSFDSDDYSSDDDDESDNETVDNSDDDDESFDSDEDPWEQSTKGKKRTKNGKGKNKKNKSQFGSDYGLICDRMKEEMLESIAQLAPRLPRNTIDELIDKLGGPDEVAEMTGRKNRIVKNENDEIIYESRNDDGTPLERLNIEEKEKFMKGVKDIAIISEAASSGISLQSDRRVKNKKRRIHITIELPWSADKAIQQFGRTHRSNQVSAPKYIFMISKLAGEKRFASTVSKRLESLGALKHGDRRATASRDLSKFNLDSKYSKQALDTLMRVVQGLEMSPIPIPGDADNQDQLCDDLRNSMVSVGLLEYNEHTNTYSQDSDNKLKVEKFLNRILGMKVDLQNCLFDYFTEIMEAYINHAKRSGKFDQGIMVFSSENGGKVQRQENKVYKDMKQSNNVVTEIEFHKFAVERGISWERAFEIYNSKQRDTEEGFYKSSTDRFVRNNVLLAIKEEAIGTFTRSVYRIYRANVGRQNKLDTLSELKVRGKKIKPDEAKRLWSEIYKLSEYSCRHLLWFNKCTLRERKIQCDEGKRNLYYYVLSGSILSIWSTVESILPQNKDKLQIIRFITDDGTRVVGIEIPSSAVDKLKEILENRQEVSKAASIEKEAKIENKKLATLRVLDNYDDSTDDEDFVGV